MKKQNIKKIEVRKYKVLSIFNSTYCSIRLPKEKEKRLHEIVKEIKKLGKELEELLK